MEKRDLDLIARYRPADRELRDCIDAHERYECLLEQFKERVHLTPAEEAEEKRIKKLKLKGRDRIEQILAGYRKKEYQ